MQKRRKFQSVSDLIDLFNTIHNSKYIYDFDKFKKVKDKIKITCPDHGVFYQSIHKHLEGQGCPKCKYVSIANKKRKLTIEQFIMKAKTIHGDKYEYLLDSSININSPIKIKCNDCGYIFNQRPFNHLKGEGCRQCGYKVRSEKRKSNLIEFEQKARIIHGEKYSYYEYIRNDEKIKIKCNKCNKYFKQKPTDHLSGKGCPHCNFSKGEELIEKILLKNNIKFVREFKLPYYKFRYDFYLPEHNLLIEFHGKQHYEPIEVFGGEENLKQIQFRDAFKRSLAREYKIKLLELNYKEFRLVESSFEKLLITYINNCNPFKERRKFGTSI